MTDHIDVIKNRKAGRFCLMPCPFEHNRLALGKMVGSTACQECKSFCGKDSEGNVLCDGRREHERIHV